MRNLENAGKFGGMSSTPELMSTVDVAEFMGVTVVSVCRWVTKGKLHPVYKAKSQKGFYMFTGHEVERFKKERDASFD